MEKTIILSLGGSVIYPGNIDISFLKNFKKIIEKYIKKNYKFVIICGGGRLARKYQESASEIAKLSDSELDWLGIYATELNAQLIKMIFNKYAEDFVISNPKVKIKFNKKILVASGWKPGWSTDYDAVLLAKNLGVKTVVNMSNVDYIYDKDPKKHKNAKKIKNISWQKYRNMVGSKWKAGLSAPFDPIAAKEAQNSRVKVVIIGKNLKNFENLLDSKEFEGTVIN